MRSRVKVVVDRHGYALYFSRGPLPAHKGTEPKPFPPPFEDKRYLLHLGLQCFDRVFLAMYCQMPSTPLMVRRALTDTADPGMGTWCSDCVFLANAVLPQMVI